MEDDFEQNKKTKEENKKLKKEKKRKKIKFWLKLLLWIVVIGFIAVLILYFGFGKDNGDKLGNSTDTSDSGVVQEEADLSSGTGNSVNLDTENDEDNKDSISKYTVTIREDQVFVGDKQIKNAEELKAYIEEINTDQAEFRLKDENSILDTYEWVTKVFEELKIRVIYDLD